MLFGGSISGLAGQWTVPIFSSSSLVKKGIQPCLLKFPGRRSMSTSPSAKKKCLVLYLWLSYVGFDRTVGVYKKLAATFVQRKAAAAAGFKISEGGELHKGD